jgi:hypothetical protein
VKIPRDVGARPWAEREWRALQELEDSAGDLSGIAFPRPVFLEISGARLAAGQTLLPGVPGDRLFATLGRGEPAYAAVCTLALDWLRAFWSRTGFLDGIEGALWEPYREALLAFLDRFEPPAESRAHLETVLREIEARREGTALCVWGHGDLIPSNLIVHEGKAAAVDWEFANRRQLPWVDPLHFVVSFSLLQGVLAKRPRTQAFARGFFEEGWLREKNFEFLARAFDEGGVPRDTLSLALPAYCGYFAVQMARFFGADYPPARDWVSMALACAAPEARRNVRESF